MISRFLLRGVVAVLACLLLPARAETPAVSVAELKRAWQALQEGHFRDPDATPAVALSDGHELWCPAEPVLTVAAAEAAIGLAILVVLFRNLKTINVDDIGTLKG